MLLFSIPFIILGFIISCFISRDIFYGIQSKKWATTFGKITHIGKKDLSGLLSERTLNDEDFLMAGSKIKARYEYEVTGEKYTGKRVIPLVITQ